MQLGNIKNSTSDIMNTTARENLITDALERFRAIYAEYPSIAKSRGRKTEADTRANILDKLIHHILGWPSTSVDRETYAQPGFVDYIFSTVRPVLVLEAKASGETFVLPHKKNPRRRMKLSGILTSDPSIRAAVSQAQRYASDIGARYAVASNGYCFILFKAILDGASWKDADAVVFHDFKDAVDNFTDFWNAFSYEAVTAGLLDKLFAVRGSSARDFERPIDQRVDADATYGRNTLTSALRPFVERFFGDIASQDAIEVLKECYVFSRPIQTIDKDLELTINDHIPAFAGDAKQILVSDLDPGGSLGRHVKAIAGSSDRPGTVVLLMGGIGSGKSTYCKRFFQVVAPELVGPGGQSMLAYLDFLGSPDQPEQLDIYMWRRLSEAIKAADPEIVSRPRLEELFADEIRTILGIYETQDASVRTLIASKLYNAVEDHRRFAEAALTFISGRKRLPIVVFDNVDQLRIEAQVQLFTACYHLAHHHSCLALLVLREESYSTALMKKHLTAYTLQPYHLSSPRFADLLKLRINFASFHAKHPANKRAHLLSDDDTVTYPQVVELFQLLRRTILGNNKNIMRLIAAIAYGNMRLALDLFNRFILSGATNMPKILSKGPGYIVPFHEFAKSVMLGDHRYYREARSPIANLFNVTRHSNASHFTALRILKYLAKAGDHGGGTYASIDDMVSRMSGLFHNEDNCVATLLSLTQLDRQLVELDSRRTDTLDGASGARITSSGDYYLHYLVKAFGYLDIVWHDTPFDTRGTAHDLASRIDKTDMVDRFHRVELFLKYLEEQEGAEIRQLNLDPDAGEFWGPFLPSIRKQYEREKEVITDRAKKRLRRR